MRVHVCVRVCVCVCVCLCVRRIVHDCVRAYVAGGRRTSKQGERKEGNKMEGWGRLKGGREIERGVKESWTARGTSSLTLRMGVGARASICVCACVCVCVHKLMGIRLCFCIHIRPPFGKLGVKL